MGDDLAVASQRHDTNKINLSGDILLRHGDFTQPPIQCLASLNQLAFGE